MDDLISRQEVLTLIEKSVSEYGDRYSVDMLNMWGLFAQVVKDMPSAQQWIPCSERLPEQNGKYLVVGRQKAINILKFDGGRWYGKWGVVAWMPLPSPYREEVSD